VVDASYLGVSTQYIVRLRDDQRVSIYEQNVERATKSELWAVGEEVVIAWAPEHCFVVGDDAAPTVPIAAAHTAAPQATA
jgi:spermidine/putrescine transport system ATP-binding protein